MTDAKAGPLDSDSGESPSISMLSDTEFLESLRRQMHKFATLAISTHPLEKVKVFISA